MAAAAALKNRENPMNAGVSVRFPLAARMANCVRKGGTHPRLIGQLPLGRRIE